MSLLPTPLSCSGFDLVSRVLDHPAGGVEALIELAGGGETDWLEFKAAMIGRPEDRKNPKENDADGYWNVAEAVLAMANSRGGVVLLGVDDNANAVGLAAGDPRRILETRGMDAFLRMEVLERIHPANSGCRWNTGLKGIWELEHPWPPGQFVIRQLRLQGKPIAALLVKPVPIGEGCLIATQNGEERLLKRVEGNLGRVESLRGRLAIPEYERTRCPSGEDLGSLLARFIMRVEKGGTQDDDLEAAIEAWHRKFQKKNADLQTTFTPLDAEERLNLEDCFETLLPAGVFEPQAEEILPDYISEDWNEDDSEDLQEDGELEETDKAEGVGNSDAEDDHAEPPAPPRVARRGGLFELLSEEPRAVLIGEPGGGKTTCLRRLALESALQYQPGKTVTLILSLAKWASSGGLWTLVRRTTDLSMGQVERLILTGRCRLLFDGLNECPDSLRTAALNELTALLENYPNLPIVISTRSAESVTHLRLPTFSVQPLSDSQQIKFLNAYLPDPERASKLFEQIQSQPGSETFAANPLLLRMIVEVAGKDGELPSGRALLYRRWIHEWYRREKEKADRAKNPLPWNEKETFEGLSAIALAARMRGSRIATEEEALKALEALVKNHADFLRRMTQSPLLKREDGHFQFRHETFQEYVCAEALLLHPEALQYEGPESYGTWGMPLAYAAELRDQLPRELKGSIWRIAPWLAAALAQPGDVIPSLPGTLGSLFRWIVKQEPPPLSPRLLMSGEWYTSDAPLRYAVSEPEARWRRWHDFEVSQLLGCESKDTLRRVLRRTLTITTQSRYFRREDRLRLADRLTEQQAIYVVAQKLLSRGDFTPEKWSQLIASASPTQGFELLKAGIASKDDFTPENRIQLIAAAKSWQVLELLNAGGINKDDFTVAATPSQAVALVLAGIVSKEDFTPENRTQLIAAVTAPHAIPLVSAGIISKDDFTPENRIQLITTATATHAISLVSAGILSIDDFTPENRIQPELRN
jgi:hypothetical protein